MATQNFGKSHKELAQDVDRELLRMLWTVHFASVDQLCRLIYNRVTEWWVRRLSLRLEELNSMNWVWREPARHHRGYHAHLRGSRSGGWYYGLMEYGRQAAEAMIPELKHVHAMTREAYFSVGGRRTIAHSTHYTEYLTRFIQDTRFDPLTLGLYIDTECTALGSHLRMDGLLRYRRFRKSPPDTVARAAQLARQPSWYVPWQTTLRLPRQPEILDRTFAIEIDESTEPLHVLQRKAENYKRTFLGGMNLVDEHGKPLVTPVAWDAVLCPDGEELPPNVRQFYWPIPVFVVGSMYRLRSLWAAWYRGWPQSEIRVTTWELLDQAQSVLRAPYADQHGRWVDLLGFPHRRADILPAPPSQP